MDAVETKASITEMYGCLRDLLANVYRDTPDPAARDMMAKMYMKVEQNVVAISTFKGFPYITYPASKEDLYGRRIMTKLARWYTASVEKSPDAPLLGRIMDSLQARAVKSGYVLDKNLTVDLLTGEELYRAYEQEVGAHSCMTAHNTYRTWMYALNPNQVQLAVVSNKKARALVWTDTEGRKLVDRVYPGTGFSSAFLVAWCQEQGYYARENNPATGYWEFAHPTKGKVARPIVKLEKLHPRLTMPYIDTFRYVKEPFSETMLLSCTANHGVGSGPWNEIGAVRELMSEYVGSKWGTIPDWEQVHRAPKKPDPAEAKEGVRG